MWIEGKRQSKKKKEHINDVIALIDHFADDEQARLMLCEFMRANIHFSAKFIAGSDIFEFQEILIRGMMDKDYFLAILSRGLSKCVHVDDLVWTKDGLKKAKDVKVGDFVQSKNGFNVVSHTQINHKQPTYKLTTQKGYECEGLDYHRVLSLTPELKQEWKFAKDLVPGDVMIMRKNLSSFTQADIFKDIVAQNNSRSSQNIALGVATLSEWYYFFGLLLGDGGITNDSVIISTEDSDIKKFLHDFYGKLNLNYLIIDYKNNNSSGIKVNSVQFREVLNKLGFKSSKEIGSSKKVIPSQILCASESNLGSLLKGLFDTDRFCSIHDRPKKNSKSIVVGYTSSSYELIKQVRAILLQLGIVSQTGMTFPGELSKFPTGEHFCDKAWSISITSQSNLRAFSNKVSFNIKRKRESLNILDEYKDQDGEFSEYIPLVGELLTKTLNRQTIYHHGEKMVFRKNMSKRLARNMMKAIEEDKLGVSDEITDRIKALLDDNLFFDAVKEVQISEAETVDMTVENEHCYVSDGIISHNTYSAGLFCCLYSIFNPGTRIGVLGPVFRQSREILKQIETLSSGPKAIHLKRCFDGPMSKKNDAYEIKFLNGSSVVALPLSDGMKIRGQRFQVVLCDEFLGFTEKIVNEVIRPFLSTNADPKMRHDIQQVENKLIKDGKMTEEDRTEFPNNKLIGLSSASYKFEYLYTLYSDYQKQILEGSTKTTYGIVQLAYATAPEGYFDESFLAEAKSSMSEAQFARELGAQFTDDSSGYFSMRKLLECSVPQGESPIIEIVGGKNDKYIMAIDPSFSEDESSDHFAITMIRLDVEAKKGYIVHNYAMAGGKLKDHVAYIHYLYTHFNVVYLVVDSTAGGGTIVNACNLSSWFKESKIELKSFDQDLEKMHPESLQEARQNYNLADHKIVHYQHFSSDWISKSNHELQLSFDKQNIWFCAPAFDETFRELRKCEVPIDDLVFMSGVEQVGDSEDKLIDLIEMQEDLMKLTREECALIQVKASTQGNLSFDLPSNLKKDTSAGKARKDNYSALLMGNWGMKCYFSIMSTPPKSSATFTPFFA